MKKYGLPITFTKVCQNQMFKKSQDTQSYYVNNSSRLVVVSNQKTKKAIKSMHH